MMDDKMKYNIEETRNLDECMDWVKSHMSSGPKGEDSLKNWVSEPEDKALMFHHGYGTFIRNTLELWYDGPAVAWFNTNGIYHADDMSSIIFTSLHRRENETQINLAKQINKCYCELCNSENRDAKRKERNKNKVDMKGFDDSS